MSPLLGGKSDRAVDDHAQQLAAFAVGEIGAKANAPGLALVRVSKLSTQVVAGIKYFFELETKDGAGATRHYEAEVWEKPGGYDNGANVELLKYKEAAQAGGSGAGGHDWDAAAAAAVAGINGRSNSLFPYELEGVASTAPAEGGSKADLVLKLKRGDKREQMSVVVERQGGGAYGLVSFTPAP
ncbi:MAG: cysteine proteinase inhibitor [Monoraphidium minutum]|nr:MAG: cysteine proteinase inhibitor [Monoraphidium minutum]